MKNSTTMAQEVVDISSEQIAKQIPSKKGGLKTMPFIIANESFEKIVSFGIASNVILYLIDEYHMTGARGASALFLWNAAMNFMPTLGAFLSDSYLGRFWVIAFGSIFCLLGSTLLWFTALFQQARPLPCDRTTGACAAPTSGQLALLFSSFVLMSIGAGGIRPCSIAFGADQINDPGNPKNGRVLQSYFNWYYASVGVSMLLSVTVIVYVQDSAGWAVGFGIPVGLILLGAILFFLGNPFYVKVKANKSLLAGFARVVVASYRNRQLVLPPGSTDGSCSCYYHRKDSKVISPSESLRFLNKACLIENRERDLDSGGRAIDPWKLCTVRQVEELKSLIKVLPIWSTGIIIAVNMNQSFPVLQATAMDRRIISDLKIPAGSFGVFGILTMIVWIVAYDPALVPLMARLTGQLDGLSLKQRMGIGLVLADLSTAVSALVESRRLAAANSTGRPGRGPRMSAMWLIPQFVLGGLAETFYIIAQIEFFYSQLPKSMASIATGLATLSMAVGNLVGSLIVSIVDGASRRGGKVSWVSSNADTGRYDYYYWILASLGLVNFLYYLVCGWAYGSCSDSNVWDEEEEEEEEEEEDMDACKGSSI